MERYYHINLLFHDGELKEREHGIWKFYRNDNEVLIDTSIYFNITNTLNLNKDGCYLKNMTNIDLSNDKKYTISIKYKIDEKYLREATTVQKEIYTLSWSNGSIKVLEFNDKGSNINVNINGKEFIFLVDYVKDSDWNHLLISYEDYILRIFYNGIKKKENRLEHPSFIFNDIKLGNYRRDLLKNKPEGPIISYDEFILVNDCLYKDEFSVPNELLSILFPEYVYDDNKEEIDQSTLVAAPYLFSNRDSFNDTLHKFDIVRHKDYSPIRENYYKRVAKYKFD